MLFLLLFISWDKMMKDEFLSDLVKFSGIYELLKIIRFYDKILLIVLFVVERDEI